MTGLGLAAHEVPYSFLQLSTGEFTSLLCAGGMSFFGTYTLGLSLHLGGVSDTYVCISEVLGWKEHVLWGLLYHVS